MVNTMALELAPIRVNAIHPGIVGDSPFWAAKPDAVLEGFRSRTPTGRLATMADIVGAVDFLLDQPRRQRRPALRRRRLAGDVTESLRVAVVGTGRMGSAMVGRLVEAGHEVTVFNRTRSRAEPVAAAHGLAIAATPRDAASAADVVIVSLADDAALRDAYLGPDGLVAGLRAGTVVADTSTVDPATIQALGAEVDRVGATLIDTPVSGSVSTVQSGQLLVMAGGDEAALGPGPAGARRLRQPGDLSSARSGPARR